MFKYCLFTLGNNQTKIALLTRLLVLTVQIRNCWNAGSVCLQRDTVHTALSTVFMVVQLDMKPWAL